MTKLKARADVKINAAHATLSVLDRIENIVGKGKNARQQHFLLYPQCFQRLLSMGHVVELKIFGSKHFAGPIIIL